MLKAAFFLLAVSALAQDSTWEFSAPVTLSAGAMHTDRLELADPDSSSGAAAFRAMFYPTVKLGSHWFGYAAVQVRSLPYFYYDAFLPQRGVTSDVIQAFLGYSIHRGNLALIVKAGRLSTAFGSFPLRYDDMDNPLVDQPLSYITEIPIRADQLLCGTNDLRSQSYGYVGAACGGTAGWGPGLQPVTLYGLPGAEASYNRKTFLEDAHKPTTDATKLSVRWLAGWTLARARS